jgi:regulator of protease activity HflC (stomatin/prohibitin superfamily)
MSKPNDIAARLLADHTAGLAADLYNAKLVGNPTFAKQENARFVAEAKDQMDRLNAIVLVLPIPKKRGAR